MLVEPLEPAAVKALILAALNTGTLRFSGHALTELAKDRRTTVDAVNVLRGGVVQPGEFENGSWRYGVFTVRMAVVVAFRSETAVVVVTAWKVGQ